MNKTLLAVVIGMIFIVGGGVILSSSSENKQSGQSAPAASIESPSTDPVTITLKTDGYDPEEITVALGTTVTFVAEIGKPHWPASNLHPAHGIYPEFDPLRPLEPDEAWSFTFTKPGTWDYHDHIRAYYNGTIHVQE